MYQESGIGEPLGEAGGIKNPDPSPRQPTINAEGGRETNLEMEQDQLSAVSRGRETNVLLESLLPPPVRSLFAGTPQPTIGSQTTVSCQPDYELRIDVLNKQSSLAEVVLSHKAAWGEVHEAIFQLGDAKKRNQFTKTCIEALKKKLTPEEREELWKKIETELLDTYQQLERQERWREQQSKITPAERLHDTERKAGNQLLKDPSLLYWVGTTLEALGLAGETVNGLLLYLAMTSRLMEKILVSR